MLEITASRTTHMAINFMSLDKSIYVSCTWHDTVESELAFVGKNANNSECDPFVWSQTWRRNHFTAKLCTSHASQTSETLFWCSRSNTPSYVNCDFRGKTIAQLSLCYFTALSLSCLAFHRAIHPLNYTRERIPSRPSLFRALISPRDNDKSMTDQWEE